MQEGKQNTIALKLAMHGCIFTTRNAVMQLKLYLENIFLFKKNMTIPIFLDCPALLLMHSQTIFFFSNVPDILGGFLKM